MFRFFKNKIYRSYFFRRLLLLTIAAVILLFFLSEQILLTGMERYHSGVSACYESVQNKLSYTVQRIEFFINRIYSDDAILSDFLRYFSNSAEGYLSDRLDNPNDVKRGADFLRECKDFATELDYAFRYVIFDAKNGITNSIRYMPDGNATFQFNLTETDLAGIKNESPSAYIYRKSLPDPENLSADMGEILFVLEPGQVFSDVPLDLPGSIFLQNTSGIIPLSISGPNPEKMLLLLPEDEAPSGQVWGSTFSRYYYVRFADQQYGLTLYAFADTGALFASQQHSSFYLFIGLAALYLLFVFLIWRQLYHDESFLSDIIASIDAAKSGNFSRTAFKKRDDAYGLIAAELNDMSDKINRFIQTEYILKLDSERAKMRALQNQIDPHFLYNTLEIIRSRALYNGDTEVSDAVSNLGNLYRSIVRAKSELPLQTEVAILNEYIHLMEFKYPDNFFFQIDIPEEMQNMMTVKLWMQPVAENFFKHGFRPESGYNLLMVIGEITDDGFSLLFSDNGTGVSEERLAEVMAGVYSEAEDMQRPSIGLSNIYSRLRHFYGSSVSMSFYNNETAGVTVRFDFKNPLPFYKKEDHTPCTDC